MNFSIKAQTAALDFIITSMVELIPTNIESITKVKTLIEKYSDLPMDYADATLVCLAHDTGIHNIVTFNTRDFNIYRVNNKNFVILP